MSERTHKKSNWSSTTPQQDSALKLRRFSTKDDKDEEIQQSPDINPSKFSLPTNSPFPEDNIQRQQLEEEKEEGEETPGAQLQSDKTTSEEPEEEIQAKSEEPNQEIDDEPVQTKLTVGQPGDKYEQEADTVAAKVVEQINSPQTNQPVQGKVEPVVKPTVMRQGGAGGGAVNQDVEQNIQQARGSGQGLAENVRQPMEQAFGADFSGVKVHTDGQADVLNRSLNSRAFATGQDIFFKQGEYQPGSKQGQELLAHELTHVVQQGETGSQVQRLCGVDESCPQDMMDSSNITSSAGMTSPDAPMSIAVSTPKESANPELFTAVNAAVSTGTLSIAVYTAVPGVEGEFRRAAQSFAEDHQSLGMRDGRIVVGRDAAVAATSTTDVVKAVNSTLRQVRILLSRPNLTVNTLALFAHGVNASPKTGGRSYLNLTGNHQITNSQQTGHGNASDQLSATDFSNQISAALSTRARVVLYACELGDAFYGGENGRYQNWNTTKKNEAHRGALSDELSRGDTSFADELRDILNSTGLDREVWGHRTTGHTTANPTWRRYSPGTQAGADNLFGEEDTQSIMTPKEGWDLKQQNIRRARDVVREIINRLNSSQTIPAETLQAINKRGHGLRGWIARELPFAPTPFLEGDPPTVREEVIQFFESQAVNHEPPQPTD